MAIIYEIVAPKYRIKINISQYVVWLAKKGKMKEWNNFRIIVRLGCSVLGQRAATETVINQPDGRERERLGEKKIGFNEMFAFFTK